MNKILSAMLAVSAFLVAGPAFAQEEANEASENYSRRYDIVVSKLGYAGVGVETILNDWEKVDSLNEKLLIARYRYHATKAQRTEIVTNTNRKYLGMNPLLSLKDSTGTDIYYYQEIFYDDEQFSLSMHALDKAIEVFPDRIDLRFTKASDLVNYEKESPDMALSYLCDIVDINAKGTKVWEYPGAEMTDELFREVIQEYCHSFYLIGSMSSYEAFKSLSQKMLSIDSKDKVFLSNLGTYYFIVAKDYKMAYKYYNKSLKTDPAYFPSLSNCTTMARRTGNVKLEKKYLKMMIQYGPEKEATLAQARLSALE